jgi:hypothetical protein
VVFSDVKVFTVEQAYNNQNARIWSKGPPGAARVLPRSQKPASVMVWAAITSDVKTPLVFIENGAKVDQKIYRQKIFEQSLLPWAETNFRDRPLIFYKILRQPMEPK